MWRRSHLGNFGTNMTSEEEQKIRAELETDIERGLEEELKDGICHLALSLHRLHLHMKDMNKPTLSNQNIELRSEQEDEVATAVKVTTKTVGGCMMQIYESKTSAAGHDVVRPCSTSRSKATRGRVYDSNKQTDWTKTLRSTTGSTAAISGMKHGISDSCRSYRSPNVRPLKKEGRSWSDTSSQTSKLYERNKNKLLELGWKY